MGITAASGPLSLRLVCALQRTAFLALLVFAATVPRTWLAHFPAVFDAASLLPFCGLVLIAVVDLRRPWQLRHLDIVALVPLLATRRSRAGSARFAAAFAVTTALLFVPAFAHSTPGAFIAQSFGFQATRAPQDTIWAALSLSWSHHAHWLVAVSAVLHALTAGTAIAVALMLPRARLREYLAGIAAASAGILLLLQLSLNDYAFSYILWFAPPLLIALVLSAPRTGPVERPPPRSGRARRRASARREPVAHALS